MKRAVTIGVRTGHMFYERVTVVDGNEGGPGPLVRFADGQLVRVPIADVGPVSQFDQMGYTDETPYDDEVQS